MNDKDYKGMDKTYHILAGFIIAAVISPIIAHIPPHHVWVAVLCGIVAAAIGGFVKEWFDRKRGHFCVWDLVATILGGCIGSIIGGLAAHFLQQG